MAAADIIYKISDLCNIQDEVKKMAERFLEYVISNHQVSSESKNILQAFLISLVRILLVEFQESNMKHL